MNFAFHPDRLSVRTRMIASAVLLMGSVLLLLSHAAAVRTMKESGLPSAMRIPTIEQRIGVLREQAEIAQLQASLSGGAEQELLHAYVLPSSSDLDRLLGTFDVVFRHLEKKGQLTSFSAVHVGEAVDSENQLQELPVTFEADVTTDGLASLMLFVRMSGLFTISDLLTPDEINTLLRLTEHENPAAITAIEQFLATDLLRFAQDPRAVEDQLLKSFSSADFEQSFRVLMDDAQMQETRSMFRELHEALRAEQLWPLRLLTIDTADVRYGDDGKAHVRLAVKAYVRQR